MGRRSILQIDPTIEEQFLKAVELGMSYVQACNYAGIDQTTFFQWQRKAEQAERKAEESGTTAYKNIYVKFINKVRKARSKCQARHLTRITQAADDGTWQASAWILERRFPEDFGEKTETSLSDSKITIVTEVPTDDDTDQ